LNAAKKILATEATALLHGRETAEKASTAAASTFEKGIISSDLPPKFIDTGPEEQWKIGRSNTAFIVAAGFAKSNSDARNKIKEGITINGKVVTDPNGIVRWDEVDPQTGGFIVRHGRKNVALVKPK
jgi:tyrosyl-tRNA synthetase